MKYGFSCLCSGTTRTRTAWSASGRSPSSSGASAATPQRRSSRCSRYSNYIHLLTTVVTIEASTSHVYFFLDKFVSWHIANFSMDEYSSVFYIISDLGFDKCSWQRRQRIHRLPRVSNDDETEGAGSKSGGRNTRGLQSVWQCQFSPALLYLQGPSKLWSDRNCIWGPLKGTKSSFKPVHLFLHFGTFGLLVLQLILASKLSELEHFENLTANNQFRKQKGEKMIPN